MRHITLIYIQKYIHFIIILCGIWALGEFLVDIKMHLSCYQKDCTGSRSVSVHSQFFPNCVGEFSTDTG